MELNSILIQNIVRWILGILFFVIGILNIYLVHPVPGLFYILFSFIYYPPFNDFLKSSTGYRLPFMMQLVLAFVLLWATLAVGDLAEIYGL